MPLHHADIGLLSVSCGTGNPSPTKPAPHRTPTPPAQRPLTHLPIPTHNLPPNQQTQERATAPRGYRPSLYERLKSFGVFRGSPPKRVFRAGPKWLWLLSPQKVMPVRRGHATRKPPPTKHPCDPPIQTPDKHQPNTQSPTSKAHNLSHCKAIRRSLRSPATPGWSSTQVSVTFHFTPTGVTNFLLRVASPQFCFAKPERFAAGQKKEQAPSGERRTPASGGQRDFKEIPLDSKPF